MFTEEELKNSPVAVLGGGAVGKTIAADCVLGGNKDVRLYDIEPYASESLKDVEKTGITLKGIQKNKYGFKRSGTAHFNLVTTDIKKAVEGSKLIIVAIPSVAHEAFFEKLVPVLEDGQLCRRQIRKCF